MALGGTLKGVTGIEIMAAQNVALQTEFYNM
jgi:hypothetical protein